MREAQAVFHRSIIVNRDRFHDWWCLGDSWNMERSKIAALYRDVIGYIPVPDFESRIISITYQTLDNDEYLISIFFNWPEAWPIDEGERGDLRGRGASEGMESS